MTEDIKVFAKTCEEEAQKQIDALAKHPVSDGSRIRIMPDVHAGAGCTIGTTMTITDRVAPSLVGVDIGCGMLAVNLGVRKLDLDLLDKHIRWSIPAGKNIHTVPVGHFNLGGDDGIRCPAANKVRAYCSEGTLGGGNHFIEVDRDENGYLWLVIHTGSRHLGLEVAKYYQNAAWERISNPTHEERTQLIEDLKAQGRQEEIAGALKALKTKYRDCGPKDLAYLTGELMADYLHDMSIVQQYAKSNRKTICKVITQQMKVVPVSAIETIHNYIDVENGILRKGAVSAQAGEKLIIPMNMRDGTLVCTGKGNPDWNYSAPHGAGRLMSRNKARKTISLSEYRADMQGIHSTCINYDTIDEAPAAYKPMAEIIECIEPTCSVDFVLKPVYNFKAYGDDSQ